MSVVYLGTCKGNTLRELADQVDAGDVTIGAFIYRSGEDTKYRLLGEEHLTYLIGMVWRTILHLHCTDSYVIPETEPSKK